MKNTVSLITIVLMSIAIYAFKIPKFEFKASSSNGIHFFKGTFTEALQKAKSENKPIFLDIYATWCGPCKILKRKTFSDKEVGDYFNANFINITIDGESDERKAIS